MFSLLNIIIYYHLFYYLFFIISDVVYNDSNCLVSQLVGLSVGQSFIKKLTSATYYNMQMDILHSYYMYKP